MVVPGSTLRIPFLDKAKENSKGVFVIVKTPNPSSFEIQDAILCEGIPVCELVADFVREWGDYTNPEGDEDYTLVGAVVGTKNPQQAARLRSIMPRSIILVPDYGNKDITLQDVVLNFDRNGCGAIINCSDNLMMAFKENEDKYKGKDWVKAAKDTFHKKQAELEAELSYYLEQTNEY